jgi:hypothetical protein
MLVLTSVELMFDTVSPAVSRQLKKFVFFNNINYTFILKYSMLINEISIY